MRKIICGVGALDGYIAPRDGSLDFLHLGPSNYSMGPFFEAIDVGPGGIVPGAVDASMILQVN